MKRTLLAAAVIVIAVIALAAANVQARDASAPKYSSPNWRYRWFEGRWWYWLPQNKWVYWSGSNWKPYEPTGQARTYTSYYGNYDAQPAPMAAQPAYSGSGYCPPSVSSARQFGRWNGQGYAGYGWSWGPGTAFTNSPGVRF